AGLVANCQRIAAALEGRKRRGAGRSAARGFLLLAVPAAAAFAVLWLAKGDVSALAGGLARTVRMLWRSLGRTTEMERWFALAVVLIVISIYNVSRTARS